MGHVILMNDGACMMQQRKLCDLCTSARLLTVVSVVIAMDQKPHGSHNLLDFSMTVLPGKKRENAIGIPIT
jgi:hypothetical protein